jgi:ribosome-binding protein aMBF1 (putative translation factor)
MMENKIRLKTAASLTILEIRYYRYFSPGLVTIQDTRTNWLRQRNSSMSTKAPHTHLYKCLGEVVSLKRKRLHLSQQELAEESGVDRVFISNIEQGKRKPSFGAVSSLAHGLKLRYSRLVEKCEECMKKSA